MKKLEYTTEGLLANLNTIEEIINGATQCLATEGLEEFGRSLLRTAIYVVGKTSERVMTKEDA